jgi:hypothetical protein
VQRYACTEKLAEDDEQGNLSWPAGQRKPDERRVATANQAIAQHSGTPPNQGGCQTGWRESDPPARYAI